MVANLAEKMRTRPMRPLQLAFVLLALCAGSQSIRPAAAQTGEEWQSAAWQLWQISIDGSGLKQLTDLPSRRCGSPVWSPDGTTIAFDSTRSDQAWNETEIATVHRDGSNFHLVGPGAVPSWSPDGSLIACQSANPPLGIAIMNADGRGRELILDHGWSARWSPRASRLAAATANGDGILIFDVATGREQIAFSGQYYLRHGFSISPDGRRICFSSALSPGLALATLDEQSMHAAIHWLLDSGIAYHSSWSPNGRRVVFAWRPTPQDTIQLYMLDIDPKKIDAKDIDSKDIAAKQEPQLVPGLDRSHNNVNPAWSPDGQSIVFSSPEPF